MTVKYKWRLKRHLCPAGYGESSVPREIKLNFEIRTEVENSCGATLNGQHWIIGGYGEKRQVIQ